MTDYWLTARRYRSVARSWMHSGQFDKAEEAFWKCRAAIARGEGVGSARWGVATIDLAECAFAKGDSHTALRRGLNAARVLEEVGLSASALPTAHAWLLVGCAMTETGDIADAVACLEKALAILEDEVEADAIKPRVLYYLSMAYSSAGRVDDATQAALAAWATASDDSSWAHARAKMVAEWTIKCLVKSNRFEEALPIWEWIMLNEREDEDWMRLYTFVGRMAEAGQQEAAKRFFNHIELLVEQGEQAEA